MNCFWRGAFCPLIYVVLYLDIWLLGACVVWHLSHVMRKPVLAICEQQRCRSACASDQSVKSTVSRLYLVSVAQQAGLSLTWSESWRQVFSWRGSFEPAHEIMVYLSHRRPAKAQSSLRIRAVSPEPSLFAHMNYGSWQRGILKIRHLALLDGCACVFEEWIYGGQKVPKWVGLFTNVAHEQTSTVGFLLLRLVRVGLAVGYSSS